MTDNRPLTFVQATNEAIRTVMRDDPNVIVMGEDVARVSANERSHKITA